MSKINTVYINPTNRYSRAEIKRLFGDSRVKFSNKKMALSGAPGLLMDVFKIGLDGLRIITSKARELRLSYEIHRKTDNGGLTYFVGVSGETGVVTAFIIKNRAPHPGRYPTNVRHQKLVATLHLQDRVAPLADIPPGFKGLQPLSP